MQFRNSETAFADAIKAGTFNTDPSSPLHAGHYMYMCTDDDGKRDSFKHILTREYVHSDVPTGNGLPSATRFEGTDTHPSKLPAVPTIYEAMKGIVTVVAKGRDGWQGKSSIIMGDVKMGNLGEGQRVLALNTWKDSRGGVSTTVSCHTLRADGAMIFAICADFSERVIRNTAVRCTEKTVRAQHDEAIRSLAAYWERAHDYYRAKDAADAARDAKRAIVQGEVNQRFAAA